MLRATPALVLSLMVAVAHAQLGLQGVRVPLPLPQPLRLPAPQAPLLDRTLQGVDLQSATDALERARQLQVRNLIRGNRTTLEADPAGAAMVRNEIVALSPSDADLALIQTAGFSVLGVRTLDGLDMRLVILQAPQGMSTAQALVRVRALVPAGSFDFNHIYGESGTASVEATGSEPAQVAATEQTAALPRTRLGLIDGGIDDAHSVFKDLILHRHGCGAVRVPSAHGTAVASLMVGRSAEFHGAAPGAELYAGDVYCGIPTGGSVEAVTEAMAWLVHERVAVMNVSLVGPPNVILEAVVRNVISRGFIIVAAVGNDGPAAAPLYPASYPGVIGVTAVDARRHILVEAARGPQVRFAAPGADMVAAKSPQGFAAVRGTSFAAPLVACLLAAQLREPDAVLAARAISDLAGHAVDLGAHGLDPVYGYGLVAADLGPDIRLAGLHAR
jgi:subtilisin family serine protease